MNDEQDIRSDELFCNASMDESKNGCTDAHKTATTPEDAHKTAATLDDRYHITNKDRENTIKNHFDENGALKSYPVKEKKKIIVLSEIIKNFSKGRTYSEKEVNSILGRIYEDHVTIRRALVDYGFIERTNDCSRYWVKE